MDSRLLTTLWPFERNDIHVRWFKWLLSSRSIRGRSLEQPVRRACLLGTRILANPVPEAKLPGQVYRRSSQNA
jgi:hypothetical protein